ncbi:MAG: Na(+)/H(+) antiporter subunit B [Alphaproteobacteria bacterium]|nr:Na(+)/H(+) antiporter subunit B [Alphaproteobacteria bacterium]
MSIPRIAAKVLIPYILLFALYVQFHGDFGPGGGFQAGVIFAAGFVLHTLAFGQSATQKVFPVRAIELMVPTGVLIYGGVGVVCLLQGGNFLDYNWLLGDPAAHGEHAHEHMLHGQHYGILLVELGVGLTVSGVMLAIFNAFVARGR